MSDHDEPALDCVDLHKAFGPTVVLDGVDLRVRTGTIAAVLGPSGGGKTTLLRLVAGFVRPDAGSISVRGTTVVDHSTWVAPHQRRIAIVPQEGALFPHLRVGANVGYGLARSRRRDDRIRECLALVGLSGYEQARPDELSGGQQQRVALARALAPNPSLVLLDEPFAALDAALRTQVRTDVTAALRAAGATALLVTHDQHEALSTADQVAVLLDGRVAQMADPVTLYRSPASLRVATFVGEATVVDGMRRDSHVECALGSLALAAAGVAGHDGPVQVVIRPEQFVLDREPGPARGLVVHTAFYGTDATVDLAVPGLATTITARLRTTELPAVGDEYTVHVDGRVNTYPA
jgi:iron(III) transport system ATP-binding protein